MAHVSKRHVTPCAQRSCRLCDAVASRPSRRCGGERKAVRRTRDLVLCLALFVGGSACTKEAPNAPSVQTPTHAVSVAAPVDEASRARFDTVRDLFEMHCGSCHLPHGEYAFELPLSVYDLTDATPLAALSDAQLAEAYRRFDEQNIPDGERKRLVRFFMQTLLFRDENDSRFPLTQRSAPAADAVVTPKAGCFGHACFDRYGKEFSQLTR